MIVQAKRNVFEGQKNEMMKKLKRLSVMTNSFIEKSCHRVMMGKPYWKGVVLLSALYGAEVIDMKEEEIDRLQKSENTAMRRIFSAPIWGSYWIPKITENNRKLIYPKYRKHYQNYRKLLQIGSSWCWNAQKSTKVHWHR